MWTADREAFGRAYQRWLKVISSSRAPRSLLFGDGEELYKLFDEEIRLEPPELIDREC